MVTPPVGYAHNHYPKHRPVRPHSSGNDPRGVDLRNHLNQKTYSTLQLASCYRRGRKQINMAIICKNITTKQAPIYKACHTSSNQPDFHLFGKIFVSYLIWPIYLFLVWPTLSSVRVRPRINKSWPMKLMLLNCMIVV